MGADVVRLWIAATDYANEMSVSDEILKRMADSYRRMRNTLRFLLGNMHGFDPARHAVPWSDLVAIDQWAIRKAFTLQNDVVTAFRNYEFHDIYQKVHNFCVVELGGPFIWTSSRIACTPPGATACRGARRKPAMYHVADAMVRWLAPILSFTAEEAWSFLPGERNESVLSEHLASSFPPVRSEPLTSIGRRSSRSRPTWPASWNDCDRRARSARRSRRRCRYYVTASAGVSFRGTARRIALFADHQPGAGH